MVLLFNVQGLSVKIANGLTIQLCLIQTAVKCGDTVLLDLTYTHNTISREISQVCSTCVTVGNDMQYICTVLTYVERCIDILYTYVRTYKVGKELTHGYIENASIWIQKGVGIGSQMPKVNTWDDWYHTN